MTELIPRRVRAARPTAQAARRRGLEYEGRGRVKSEVKQFAEDFGVRTSDEEGLMPIADSVPCLADGRACFAAGRP